MAETRAEAGGRLPLRPRHPERICWGCERYCPADDLGCANGAIRTAHPIELFGEDWLEWEESRGSKSPPDPQEEPENRQAAPPAHGTGARVEVVE